MTQKEQVLKRIWNKWAGPHDFMVMGIAQYNARIHYLKKDGWRLESKSVKAAKGQKDWKEHRMNASENPIMVAEHLSRGGMS